MAKNVRVRWDAIGASFLMSDSQVKRKLEVTHIKKQIEVLTTFIPDHLLNMSDLQPLQIEQFVAVLLFADISGFTTLCEKYNKTGKGGIYRLTATLNAYIGALVEVICFYGGDVLKFSGDALLSVWRVNSNVCLYQVIHHVIVCALFMQQKFGVFETEVNVQLKVKLAISCGNMSFAVIGQDKYKYYLILGTAIAEVKQAEHASSSGEVVIAPAAWGHLAEDEYQVTYTSDGNVKVWGCIYHPKERAIKEEYAKKREIVNELAERHIKHRLRLHELKRFDNILTDSKIIENFIRSLPSRPAIKTAPQKWVLTDLQPFIIKTVAEQVEEKQAIEYLTEMREVTIQFINIVPASYETNKVIPMVNSAYNAVCSVVSSMLGVVNKISMFDKDAMILVLFGLRGVKHELESQNALKSAYSIRRAIVEIDEVKSISIGVTNGLVYCGVVGHPHRREYTVIGAAVNKAARMMCGYENKVTCDHITYKNSKLSSSYFQLQDVIKMKGIEDPGHIFEYNEDFEEEMIFLKEERPFLGRDLELNIVSLIVSHPDEICDCYGVCFRGELKSGKSRMIAEAYIMCKNLGHTVALVELYNGPLRPYYCISLLYGQIYDANATLDSPNSAVLTGLPRDIWNFYDVLHLDTEDSSLIKFRKHLMVKMFTQLCKGSPTGVTVVFVDNVQHIDKRSCDILFAALKNKAVHLVCAGTFEEDSWDVLWNFSLCNEIKVVQLTALDDIFIAPIICQFLSVKGVPKKLNSMVKKTCEGRPGWIESCILRLVNNGTIEVEYILPDEQIDYQFIFPDPKLIQSNYLFTKDSESPTVIPVVTLSGKFTEHDDVTLAAISLDLFDSFTAYQQLVIKTASVLSEVFTRYLLIITLRYPNEQIFASAIKNLFEEDVFDCGSRYSYSGKKRMHNLACYCYTDSEVQQELPKYAYCKLLHFKNKNLRTLAYELLPANQKKELHLKTAEVLENQNNSCPNCLRDNSAAIMKLMKFSDFCAYAEGSAARQFDRCEENDFTEENLKDVIRNGVANELKFEGSQQDNVSFIPQRKIWDPRTCFCLEILTKVYADLVHHSVCAGHIGKRIYFLTQYSIILTNMHELEDAIPLLTQASELCMSESNQQFYITQNFRKVIIGKIHLLLCTCHLGMGNISTAKNHVMISLRQYDIPMMSLRYSIPNKILNRFCLVKARNISLLKSRVSPALKADFGICMSLVSNIFAKEGHWNLAKLAAARSLDFLKRSNANFTLLCDIYCNAIKLYNFSGDLHVCEKLERCINLEIVSYYTSSPSRLSSKCKLLNVIMQSKALSGYISAAVQIGYREMELNMILQSIYLQIELLPILASLLLMLKRIEEAVQVSRILQNFARKYDPRATIGYYAFCVELLVETNFILESVDMIESSIEQHYFKGLKGPTDLENKLSVYLYCYYIRESRLPRALHWKYQYKPNSEENCSIISIMNLLKFTEANLLMFVRDIQYKKRVPQTSDEKVETLLRKCEKAASTWPLFVPRFMHYKAYYIRIKGGSRRKVEDMLNRAFVIAEKQENILEQSWLNRSKNAWGGGYNFEMGGWHCIFWINAKTYTSLQWSQIMYVLPIP